jgi:hypothetical protein
MQVTFNDITFLCYRKHPEIRRLLMQYKLGFTVRFCLVDDILMQGNNR